MPIHCPRRPNHQSNCRRLFAGAAAICLFSDSRRSRHFGRRARLALEHERSFGTDCERRNDPGSGVTSEEVLDSQPSHASYYSCPRLPTRGVTAEWMKVFFTSLSLDLASQEMSKPLRAPNEVPQFRAARPRPGQEGSGRQSQPPSHIPFLRYVTTSDTCTYQGPKTLKFWIAWHPWAKGSTDAGGKHLKARRSRKSRILLLVLLFSECTPHSWHGSGSDVGKLTFC